MGEEVIKAHLRAAEEYFEAAIKLMDLKLYFAAVLCAAVGLERSCMALILKLGARPAAKHRHHEVLNALRTLIPPSMLESYDEVVEIVAELMGHLTMVRYKTLLAGKIVTPKQLYDEKVARQLVSKALRAHSIIKEIVIGM